MGSSVHQTLDAAHAMERLADTFSTAIEPEPARVVKPRLVRLDGPLAATAGTTSPASYEASVFNFLYAHKHELGIRDVWKCRAVRIDGLLDLDDGQRVVLEVKYRMNWEKACQACAQFSWFLRHPEAQSPSPTGALVVFEEFARDWARRSPRRLLEEGWNYWYTDHGDVEGRPAHLARIRDGTYESYRSALAAARGNAR